MAYDVSNFLDNDDVSVIAERGPFKVIQYDRDLSFTVEKSGKSLLGSAVSGEGFVNVYSGTGRVLLMPQV